MKPQVKETEKSRVLTTKDYSMFDFLDFKVSKGHLNKVKESIALKNLSQDYPILVSGDNYQIIEGRYRFLACYDLQLPIYYKVSEVTTLKDAIRIKHIHKNISIEDVVKVYADHEPYNQILLMHEEFQDFSLTFIVYSIKCLWNGISRGRDGHEKLTIKRSIFDSGQLPLWSYNDVRKRLLRTRRFKQCYSEFGWTEYDLAAVDAKFAWIPKNSIKEYALKNAHKLSILAIKANRGNWSPALSIQLIGYALANPEDNGLKDLMKKLPKFSDVQPKSNGIFF